MSEKQKQFQELVGPSESVRMMDSLKRGATRRDVLAMLTAGGMQATLAGGIASLATTAHAQTPKKGGRIKVASSSSGVNDTLDPARQSSHVDYCRGFMFYNGLTVLDGSLSPQPQLAEEFTTKDAQTWVFKLRKGVTFHNGKPLTPADVVFSMMRHKDPATASRAKVLADQIESVTATGPNEVTFRLTSPNADLPVILGTYHFHIVPEGTTNFAAGIGTGPFKVKEFKPGERSIAVRNDNYWKPNRPYLDEIELVGISDESARVNALLSGQLDLVVAVSPRSINRVLASGTHTIFETKATSYTNLIMRRDSSPGNNPDFVLAMKHLFNREQLLKSIQLGRGVVANDQPIASNNRFFFKGLPQRAYDPEKAKWHLQKANLGSAPIPVVASPAATNSVETALVMQHAAKQIGLNLDVKRMPADGYWSTHWMKHPVGFGNINTRPSADLALTLFFKSDAPWNEAGWKNEKFDQLLVAARGETDQTKRAQMYADMQVMIHQDGGIGIPFFTSSLDGHSKQLKGLSPIPIGGMMGTSFAEHVWLDAAA
ncbi:extracellular solute-binding protein [Hydrogenophaga taeniospiralis CCUG 15921]|uniref:Extracellular solute-binding protein n=1 Tax=Hydrogenophaga taeniospiralis CCUG 15921 TaxID=1281780 RepID=A0A9X4SEF9_9BURK|nr:ABC transporter substrate-binding protein [Hydrogenophaga taeniospiralis]MDG5975016.1 extracellular solute-binding protein [Hydrogenophaga taeniospiralis CCUG 15921]